LRGGVRLRKFLIVLMLLSIAVIAPTETQAKPDSEQYPIVNVKVKGACNDQSCGEGFNINGTTYVPIRLVLETMGATVQWNQSEQSVQIMRSTVNTSLVNPDQEYLSDSMLLYEDLDELIDRLLLLDRQIDIAVELYDQTKELQWWNQISKGKLPERKKTVAAQAEETIKYQKKYELQHSDVDSLTELIHHLEEIMSYMGLAAQSYEQYITTNNANDYKSYLVYRKLGLDSIELTKEQLGKLKDNPPKVN